MVRPFPAVSHGTMNTPPVFDPSNEQFIGNTDTSKLLRREYRKHWAATVG